jgi:lysophospholipase L1-like esterase
MVSLAIHLMATALCVGVLASCEPPRPTIEVLGDSISAYSAAVIASTLDPTGPTRVRAVPSASAAEMQPYAGIAGPVDVAVIELGANDIWRGQAVSPTVDFIAWTVAAGYLQRGARCVVFVTLPTETGIPAVDAGFASLSAWFRARPFYADYGAGIDADPTMTTDRLHPSVAGQAMLADRIAVEVHRCLA